MLRKRKGVLREPVGHLAPKSRELIMKGKEREGGGKERQRERQRQRKLFF
jgi:hypothetical protein